MRAKTPVYDEIKQSLKSRIQNGEWGAGDKIPSENELVDQLGVGRHRVRPALRELELEGYIVRRRGSGSYVAPVSDRATVVKTADQNTVAMFFPRYTPGYPRQVVHGFMQHMAAAGRRIIVYNIETDQSSESDALRAVVDSGVSGLVLWIDHDTPANRRYLISLTEKRFPVVLIDRYLYGLEIDSVVSANEDIGYRLARALVDLGHKRIAFVGHKEELSSTNERFQGYQRALREAGLLDDNTLSGPRPSHPFYLDLERTRARPAEQVAEIMALKHRPSAFLRIHDGFADRISAPLARMGFEIPGDIELAAVDDGEAKGNLCPARLHITQQGFEVGAQSADVLLARMANPDAPVQKRVILAGPVFKTSDVQPAENAMERRADTADIPVVSRIW